MDIQKPSNSQRNLEKEKWNWRNQPSYLKTLGVGDGQGDLACCDSWGRKESDTTEPLI